MFHVRRNHMEGLQVSHSNVLMDSSRVEHSAMSHAEMGPKVEVQSVGEAALKGQTDVELFAKDQVRAALATSLMLRLISSRLV